MRRLVLLLTALMLALAGLVAGANSAQAAGWAGARCSTPTPTTKVCVNVHTVPSGNGIRVDQVQLCVEKHPAYPYPSIRGSFNNTILFVGSSGNGITAGTLGDTGASEAGVCVYYNPIGAQMGNGACFKANGTLDFPQWSDTPWSVNGKVLGGAYNCG